MQRLLFVATWKVSRVKSKLREEVLGEQTDLWSFPGKLYSMVSVSLQRVAIVFSRRLASRGTLETTVQPWTLNCIPNSNSNDLANF